MMENPEKAGKELTFSGRPRESYFPYTIESS